MTKSDTAGLHPHQGSPISLVNVLAYELDVALLFRGQFAEKSRFATYALGGAWRLCQPLEMMESHAAQKCFLKNFAPVADLAVARDVL